MATVDLFGALDALFTKAPLEGSFPSFFLQHRFLASDKNFAIAARYLQKDIRDDDMLLRVWQAVLPKAKGAPRLTYVAPKKSPEADALVGAMMKDLNERRVVVEEMLELHKALGNLDDLFHFYGVSPPEETPPPKPKKKKTK